MSRSLLTTFVMVSLCASALWWSLVPAHAQVRPVYDQGVLGLVQLLKRINSSATVLMIGAHPDDEDTALLAYLARGENARTAYLSLTRGDGGQNIIGPELRESLGVIRTEELLQARRLDGGEQYFTRAYDYGFSKTLDEARQKWDEKIILCDVVSVIREFRPLVVISQFTGTPADGHGQHQYAGYISPLAVKAAAEVGQCQGSGMPWKVKKFYIRHRGSGEPSLRINTGKYDPVLGRSYFEIAMEARSQHKSQEQGVLQLRGPQFSSLDLVGSLGKESGIFDGLDISVRGIAEHTNNDEAPFVSKLNDLQITGSRALVEYEPRAPEKILNTLAYGYRLAFEAERSTRIPASKAFMRQKLKEFSEAIRLAAGIQIDALADRETVTPGETTPVAVRFFTSRPEQVRVKQLEWRLPYGWSSTKTEVPEGSAQPSFRRESANYSAYFNIQVSPEAKLSQPYWLERQRRGDLYEWPNDERQTRPFGPPAEVVITVVVEGSEIPFNVPLEYRFADDIRGEVRRNVVVAPTIAVELDQSLLIVPTNSSGQSRSVTLSIMNNAVKPVSGTAAIASAPDGDFRYRSDSKDFRIDRKGEKATLTFDIMIPANPKPGSYSLVPAVTPTRAAAALKMNIVAYPHIQSHRFYTPAGAKLEIFDLRVEPVRVGYIAGSGDAVPDAIRQLGLAVEMISEGELSAGNLSRFDVIVVGIRASQVRPDLISNQPRLTDFMKNGGTLLVQYQLPVYQSHLPYPAQIGPRVADENAPVTFVNPDHPLLNFPNRITQEDFKGWVQERNLYDLTNFAGEYVPLLESHDAGEPENKGGLVVADIGKGKFIYCSYSLFRQLPAGVPGAYRLLANLLSAAAARNAGTYQNASRALMRGSKGSADGRGAYSDE